MNPDGMAGDRWSRLEELNRRVAFRIRARYGGEGRVDRTSANPFDERKVGNCCVVWRIQHGLRYFSAMIYVSGREEKVYSRERTR